MTIKAKQRADGVRYQVYGKRNGRKVYVGTYDTENEAKQADFSYRTAPIGSAVSFRVIAIYANGVEREISAFDVAKECPERGYARGIGYLTDDEEFCIFVAQRPRRDEFPDETAWTRPIPEGAPF